MEKSVSPSSSKSIKPYFSINMDDVDAAKFVYNPLVERLLRLYNRKNKTKHKLKYILSQKCLLQDFLDYIFVLSLKWKIRLEPKDAEKFTRFFKEFKEHHYLTITESDKFYDEIVEKIYSKNLLDKDDDGVKNWMLAFKSAYSLMKWIFRKKIREGKDDKGKYIRYFEHLKWVSKIALNELPNPNLNKIIIALLHDSIEDIKWFDFDIIKAIYGEDIAKWVQALSKRDIEEYLLEGEEYETLSPQQKEKMKRILTERRNEDYFGHMWDLDDDILDIKFADRIHNLRDIDGCDKNKIIRKIKETEKYFLQLAKDRNIVAYNLMMVAIRKSERKIWKKVCFFK